MSCNTVLLGTNWYSGKTGIVSAAKALFIKQAPKIITKNITLFLIIVFPSRPIYGDRYKFLRGKAAPYLKVKIIMIR